MQRKVNYLFRFLLLAVLLTALVVPSVSVSASSHIPMLTLNAPIESSEIDIESALSSSVFSEALPAENSEPLELPVESSVDNFTSMEENIAAIRQNSDLWLYLIFPLGLAILIIILFCRWFYRSFIENAMR